MNTVLSTACSTALNMKDNPYQILPHSAAIKNYNITSNSQHTMQTQHCSQFLHTRQTIPAMLNSNYIGYKVSFIPTKCFIGKKLTFRLLILRSSSCRAYTAVFCACCVCQCFFSGPLGGEISPPNTNKFKQTAGCFSHFLSPQKQFPPLNYISRKNPGVCSNEEQSKRQLFSNKAFGWKKGYFVTMNNRTSLREQLYCIHPQHTHSPCTSTCTTHPAIPSQLPSTTLLCTQLTNTKHSWQNGTRCRDGVNVLWCRSHLVWLVFEGSIPTCAGFSFGKLFCDLCIIISTRIIIV